MPSASEVTWSASELPAADGSAARFGAIHLGHWNYEFFATAIWPMNLAKIGLPFALQCRPSLNQSR